MKLAKRYLKISKNPWFLIAAVGVVVALVVLVFPMYAGLDARFYNGYASLKSKYSTWEGSTHKDVSCIECHSKPELINSVLWKARSIAEVYKKYLSNVRETSLLEKPSNEACIKCHERPVSMLRVLSLQIPHRAHPDLKQVEKNCAECHKWLVHKEGYQKRHKKQPMNAVCLNYGCHAGALPKDDCTSCHHRASIKEAKWIKSHSEVVDKKGENSCFDYCHNVDYCRICHTTGQKAVNVFTKGTAIQPGDLIAKHTNLSNWIGEHGEEALVDTSKCLNCHITIQYCNSCHKKRPASHGQKERWISVHKRISKEDKKGCLTCHQEKTCDKCHQLFREKGL